MAAMSVFVLLWAGCSTRAGAVVMLALFVPLLVLSVLFSGLWGVTLLKGFGLVAVAVAVWRLFRG